MSSCDPVVAAGFTVACFNRTVAKVDEFLQGRAKGKNIIGAKSVKEFVASLKKPRKVMIMVRAGQPVDETIHGLLPFLEKVSSIPSSSASFVTPLPSFLPLLPL